MRPVIQWEATYPAPPVVTTGTAHMTAAFILLNRYIALRAFMSPDIVSPAFKLLFLVLFTSLIEMPLTVASIANILSTGAALNLFSPFFCLNHAFTIGCRTEFFIGINGNLVVKHQPLELLE